MPESLLPVPLLASDVEPGLIALAERRMLAPARQRGYELRLVGATVLPQRQVIARSSWGTWIFTDHVLTDSRDGDGGVVLDGDGIPGNDRTT